MIADIVPEQQPQESALLQRRAAADLRIWRRAEGLMRSKFEFSQTAC